MNKEEKWLIVELAKQMAELKEMQCGNSGLNWYNQLLIDYPFLVIKED
jgi:hypothetical protein